MQELPFGVECWRSLRKGGNRRRRRLPQPPATPKMGGWFGEPPLPRPRVSVMPAQLRMPPFEVLTGYAPGQWRLRPAQLARIQRLAEHIVRTWTTASPVYRGPRLSDSPSQPEAQAGLQRAVAARAALTDAIRRLNPGIWTRHSIQRGGRTAGPCFRWRYSAGRHFLADRTQNALCSACWDTAPGDRAPPLHFATVG